MEENTGLIKAIVRIYKKQDDRLLEVAIHQEIHPLDSILILKKLIKKELDSEIDSNFMVYDLSEKNQNTKKIEDPQSISDNMKLEDFGKSPHFIISSQMPLKFETFCEEKLVVMRQLTYNVRDLKLFFAKEYGLSERDLKIFYVKKRVLKELDEEKMLIENKELFRFKESSPDKLNYRIETVLKIRQMKVSFTENIAVKFSLGKETEFTYELSPNFLIEKLKILLVDVFDIEPGDQVWTISSSPEKKPLENSQFLRDLCEKASKLQINVEKENKQEIEFFRNLKESISDYPAECECLEKELLEYTLKVNEINEKEISHVDLQKLEKKAVELEKLAKEEYPFFDFSHEFKEFYAEIPKKEKQKLIKAILEIFNKINPINLESLSRQLSHSDKNAIKLVSKKKIFVFLGMTGCGKSTTICYLSQCKMKKDETRGIIVDYNSTIPAPCKIGHSIHSETKGFNPVKVSLPKGIKNKENHLILCDTAGFNDTGGAHIDLLNSLSIVNAIQKASGVKPVVIISQGSIGGRFEGLKSLAKTLIRMIHRFYLNAFEYFFVDFPEDSKEFIINGLNSLISDLSSQDKEMITILEDMKSKVKILNPITQTPSPTEILKEWASFGDEDFVQNPDETFFHSFSNKTISQAEKQVEIIQKSVNLFLERKNPVMLEFKLSQLKKLHEFLSGEFNLKYSETIQSVAKQLNQYFEKEIDAFIERLGQNPEPTIEEIQSFLSFDFFKPWEERFRKEYLTIDLHTIDIIKNRIISKLAEIILANQESCFPSEKKIPYLKNLAVVSPFIRDNEIQNLKIDDIIHEFIDILKKNFEREVSNVQETLQTKKYGALINFLNQNQQAMKIFSNIEIIMKKMTHFYEKYQKKILSYFNELEKGCQLEEDLELNQVKTVFVNSSSLIQNLEQLENFKEMEYHSVFQEKIKELRRSVLKNIDSFLENQRNKIKESLDRANYKEISENFAEINVKEILTFAQDVKDKSPILHSMIKSIFSDFKIFTKKMEVDTSNIIKDLHEKKQNINYNRLNDALKFIEINEKIIYEIVPSAKFIFSNIKEEITTYVNDKKEEFSLLSLSYEDFNQSEIEPFILYLFKLKKYGNLNEIVEGCLKDISESFVSLIQQNLQKLEDLSSKFEKRVENPLEIEKIIGYLNFIKKIERNNTFQTYIPNIKSFAGFFSLEKFLNKIDESLKALHEQFINFFEKKAEQSKKQAINYVEYLKKLTAVSNLPSELNINKNYKASIAKIIEFKRDIDECLYFAMENLEFKEIFQKLAECKKLFDFDVFLDNENRFDVAFSKYNREIGKKIKELENQASTLIKLGDYEKFHETMTVLKQEQVSRYTNKTTMSNLKSSLENSIKELLENIENQMNMAPNATDLNYAEIKEIYKNLEDLRKLQKEFSAEVSSLDLKNKLQKYQNDFTEIFLKQIEKINNSFNCYRYKTAEERLERFNWVFHLKRILNNDQCKKIENARNNLIVIKNKSFDKLLDQLEKLQLFDFDIVSPKEIFETLKEMDQKYDGYAEISKKYPMKLREKMKNEVADVKQGKKSKNELEASLSLMPDFIKKAIEFELRGSDV